MFVAHRPDKSRQAQERAPRREDRLVCETVFGRSSRQTLCDTMSALDYFVGPRPPSQPRQASPQPNDPEREQMIARAWAERDAVRNRQHNARVQSCEMADALSARVQANQEAVRTGSMDRRPESLMEAEKLQSPPAQPVMPDIIYEAPPSPSRSPPSPIILAVSKQARAQRSGAPPPMPLSAEARPVPVAGEAVARKGGAKEPSEVAFREDDVARLAAEFKIAQQAIIDLHDQLKRRDEIIAQKEVVLARTRRQAEAAGPSSIQPTSRTDFDQIQVAGM